MEHSNRFHLPLSIVGTSDISSLQRELNAVDDFFVSANIRAAGSPVQTPRVTKALESIARENGYSLLEETHRKALTEQFKIIKQTAPKIHISFAAEPSPKALERILAWFRGSVHPQALIQVGLQPNIAAGCVIRTPNKLFDMSLRVYLEKQENYLIELIKGAANGRR